MLPSQLAALLTPHSDDSVPVPTLHSGVASADAALALALALGLGLGLGLARVINVATDVRNLVLNLVISFFLFWEKLVVLYV